MKQVGPDGVTQIYPTKKGASEFYLNQDDPYKGGGYSSKPEGQFNISYGHGSQFPFTKKTENGLTFFNTEGSPITYASGSAPGRSTRLDVYAAGGKWANKTKYSWENNPGYLYTEQGVGSGEFTVYIRTHGDLGTHQAYACKIGGRDEDDLRSLIEMVYPTASHDTPQINYNYAHFPYVNAKATIVKKPPKLVAEKWIGVKCVHKIAADKKSTDWELWYDENPFSGGKPSNNWELCATYTDKGCNEYKNIPLTWKAHKDLCRVDGFKNVDFCLISDREIDFMSESQTPPVSTPPATEPTTPPTDTVPPTQTSNFKIPRVQTRETVHTGDPVDAQYWTVTSDTGAITVGTPQEIKLVSITASGDDGNKAENLLDNDSSNRWSCKGLGSWVKPSFGVEELVTQIEFTWYDKPPRTYDVTVAIGGQTLSHQATLATSTLQLGTPAKATDFTVTLVNTSNPGQWFSITAIKVLGMLLNEQVTTPTPGPGGEQPQPPSTQPPVTQPPTTPAEQPPATATTTDWFGVQKIYDDLPKPYKQWHHTDVNDPLYYEQKPKLVTGSGLDQWLTFPKLDQGRIEVLPVAGLKDSDIETFDYSKVIKKGYLHLPRDDPSGNGDWGDIEMTAALRNVVPGSGSFESHFEFVRGGFRQTNDTTPSGKDKAIPAACQAMSIHSNIYPPPGSDRTKYEKDTKHTDCYTAHDPEFKNAPSKAGIDQKKGYIFKTVYYRVADSSQNGGYAMKMEQYLSTDGLVGKKFVMASEYLDAGKWGPCRKAGSAKSCGCPNEFPIHSMDICCPGIRIDFMKSFEFGKFSIRSIDPKKKLI